MQAYGDANLDPITLPDLLTKFTVKFKKVVFKHKIRNF